MKTAQEKYNERLNRIKTAVELGKPDRVPMVFMGDAFCVRHMNVKMSRFCTDPEFSNQTIIDSFTALGDIDGSEEAFVFLPALSAKFFLKVKIAGFELKEGELWQFDEQELMTPEDYDRIIEKGFESFRVEFWRKHLDNVEEKLQKLGTIVPKCINNMVNAGLVPYAPVYANVPSDTISGGRSMAKYMKDLYKMPDKVQEVQDIIHRENMETFRKQIRAFKPFAVFVGAARGASEFYSPKLWHRYIGPYIKQIVEMVVEEGAVAHLHFDSNWERDLDFFRSFPKGKCVFGTDHSTNIYKLKEKLGDIMCIKGDVPPALLMLGTEDEVYNYSTKLIKEIGPSGFILAPACTLPQNAKVENIKAMIAAATGK